MTEVALIVDQYRLWEQKKQLGRQQNPSQEAAAVTQMVNVLGRNRERHAIVELEDKEGFQAYGQENFNVELMNGNRHTEINEFVDRKQQEFEVNPPDELVVISDDPTFNFLLKTIQLQGKTKIRVWVPGSNIPNQLNNPDYSPRLLEDVLPQLKIPRIDIRLDFENLHQGLKRRGWKPNVKALVNAIKKVASELGDMVRIVAYADWDILQREDRRNWQRQLAELGVETRYMVNERGKNTADMKIADEIRDLIEHGHHSRDSAEVVIVATNDRDFRSVLETAKQRGQRVVLLAIRGGLSKFLKDVVKEGDIRYLDDYLELNAKPTKIQRANSEYTPHPADEHVPELVQISGWLQQRNWFYAPTKQLVEAETLGKNTEQAIQQLLKEGLLWQKKRQTANGVVNTVTLSNQHPLSATIQHMSKWLIGRLTYCYEKREMPYVDSNFLAKGMAMDNKLRQWGVGQNRYEAESWLELFAEADAVIREEMEHPKAQGKTITVWRLPKPIEEGKTEELVDPKESLPVGKEPETNASSDVQTGAEKPRGGRRIEGVFHPPV